MEDQQLTENIIKKVALRFFRHYYKFRLRYEDQPVVAKYDLEGVGGIVADGYYSFKKPDGKLFTATFEATSKESKDEVMFKADKRTLLWDGLAVTCISMVALAFFNLRSPFHSLDNTKIGERTALLFLVGLVVLGLFVAIARNFRRYRYIYAVEQFKKYFADEQWIALSTDVFENSNDRYLRELKSQCVFNGLGLLTIDKNLDPKIIITPSRHDIFAGKRQALDFLPQKKAQEVAQKGKLDLFPALMSGGSRQPKSLLRYRKSNHTQIALMAASMVLLAIIFMKEMENPALQVVEKQEFTEKIAKSKSNGLEEPSTYLPDSSSMPKRKKAADGKFWDLENAQETTTVPAESPTNELADNSKRSVGTAGEFTEKGVGNLDILYDCSRFYNFDGKKYIVEVGEYNEYKLAATAVTAIRSKGVFSAALLKSCFTDERKGYMVYAGEIYNSAAEASKEMDAWVAKQKMSEKFVANWKIRAIEPNIK